MPPGEDAAMAQEQHGDGESVVVVSRLRFLVVEDQGFQRWMIGNMLRTLGARSVQYAANGASALDVLREARTPIDIVVCDLDMPGMDGMEFIRHVGDAASSVSMVICSGMERTLVTAVEAMTQAYGVRLLGAVDKPPTPRKLEGVIRRYGNVRMERPAAALPFALAEIEAALARGEFVPFFQPKVETRTGRVVGAEALARWNHPERGWILPHEFIPAIEQSTLMDTLTRGMLDGALRTCRAWRDTGLDASVAVNLSLNSLADVSFADALTAQVRAHSLEPAHVVLEITESAEAAHLGKALENFSRLRMRGFGLSIDDYGLGYSSMQQLSRVPFTELKIDQGFVRNAASRRSSRAMLESSLEMAQKLSITAVAEGVENRSEWDLLRLLGCPVAQGHYIAKPMPAGEVLEWMRRAAKGG